MGNQAHSRVKTRAETSAPECNRNIKGLAWLPVERQVGHVNECGWVQGGKTIEVVHLNVGGRVLNVAGGIR